MQNIQTTNEQPTIADLLNAYRDDIDAKEHEQAEHMRERAEENAKHLRGSLQGFLSPELFAALDLHFGRSVRYPTSDMAEAYFTVDGVSWSIYLDEEWTIQGEQGYTRCPWPVNDTVILSAIAEYPAWLERQQKKERGKAEPRTYTEIVSAIPGDSFLHRGAKVQVNYSRYYNEDSSAVWGTIADWGKQFLLLTLSSGRQMLINWQHISSIEPLYPDQQMRTQPEPTRYNDDITSDNVPF